MSRKINLKNYTSTVSPQRSVGLKEAKFWLFCAILPVFALKKYEAYDVAPLKKKAELKLLDWTLLFVALAVYVGGCTWAALAFEVNWFGSLYAVFFLEWPSLNLAANFFAWRHWRARRYDLKAKSNPAWTEVPQPKEMFGLLSGTLPKTPAQMRLARFMNWISRGRLSHDRGEHENLRGKYTWSGTEFTLGYMESKGGEPDYLRYGWRSVHCMDESFYPRHLLLAGFEGYGKQMMKDYLLAQVNAGKRKNRLAFFLCDYASGTLDAHQNKFPGVATFSGNEVNKALAYLAGEIVILRNGMEGLGNVAEIVVFADGEISAAILGLNEEYGFHKEHMGELVRLGKRNGVHLVLTLKPEYHWKMISAALRCQFDLVQYFQEATYAVAKNGNGGGNGANGKQAYLKVKTPQAVYGNFLFEIGLHWHECKHVELTKNALHETLREHEMKMGREAKSLLEECEMGLPGIARWQKQAEQNGAPVESKPRYKVKINGA